MSPEITHKLMRFYVEVKLIPRYGSINKLFFGQFQVFADFEYFIFDELSYNFSRLIFMNSNNHFS